MKTTGKNTYECSDGTRVTQAYIDRKMSESKKILLELQFMERGYNVCEKCLRNDCKPVDCSHHISVDQCKKQGKTELAWDVDNMEPTGRDCHTIKDKLHLQWSKNF